MIKNNYVHVVDDDEAVLLSVQAVLGQHGYQVSCYSSAEQFLAEAPLDGPGCVVTDVQMPGIDGIELQCRLLEMECQFSSVVVTGVADVPTAVKLMQRGAITLLEKPYDHVDLLRAVEQGLVASLERWRQQRSKQSVQQRLATLTGEEGEVLSHMLAGKANKSVARTLAVSMRTLDRRRQAVLRKMGANSVPELALMLGAVRGECREIDPAKTNGS
jgi:two-component system response regulator FixJ